MIPDVSASAFGIERTSISPLMMVTNTQSCIDLRCNPGLHSQSWDHPPLIQREGCC